MMALAFLVPLGLLIRTQAEDRALGRAQRAAEGAAAALAVASSLQESQVSPALADAVVALFGGIDDMSVVLSNGYVAGRQDVDEMTLEAARAGAAFNASRRGGGVEVLVPVGVGAGEKPSVVRVVVEAGDLRRGVEDAWVVLALLGALLVAAAVAVADRMGRTVTKPMGVLAAAADRLGEGDLDHRVRPQGPPEIVEVGEAFNTLATRLRRLLEAERESMADLSHRLRTPLAALRLGVETLPASPDRDDLLADVLHLESAVSELITDARRGAAEDVDQCNPGSIGRERAMFWEVLAQDEGRQFSIEIEDELPDLPLSGRDLGTVLDTLLENVFTHTPSGTAFSLLVKGGGESVVIEVGDEGPGFDRALADRGKSEGGSTGLGLDIVRRLVTRAGGQVILHDPPGATVELRLPGRSPADA